LSCREARSLGPWGIIFIVITAIFIIIANIIIFIAAIITTT